MGCCEEDAEFSPDGRTIVFERQQGQSSLSALFVMGADGSGLHRITSYTSEAGQPDWSPDGRWIVFNTGSESDPFVRELMLIHPDGTGLHGLGEGYQPDWSPDGTKILFVREGDLWVREFQERARSS